MRNAEFGMRNGSGGFDAVFRPPHSLGFLHEPLLCHVINEYHCPLPTLQKHFVVRPRDWFPPPLVIDPPCLTDSLDRHHSGSRWQSTCIELYLNALWNVEGSKSVSSIPHSAFRTRFQSRSTHSAVPGAATRAAPR